METNLLIAGIPAAEWVGRRARFWGHENKQHPTPCLIMGIDNRKVIIKPIGHKKEELVEADKIAPTWKHNDDLRQKYAAQLNGSIIEDPEDADEEPTLARTSEEVLRDHGQSPEAPHIAEPTVSLKLEVSGVPLPTVKQPRMVINNHSEEWMPTYQLYLDALKAEAGDRLMLVEVNKAITAHVARQAELVKELETLGVEILDDEIPTTQPAPPPERDVHRDKPGKRRGRIAMDRHILDWGKQLKARIAAGEEVKGNVGFWSTELGISWKTLGTRLSMLHKVLGLQFTDEHGRKGDDCRGTVTVTVKAGL